VKLTKYRQTISALAVTGIVVISCLNTGVGNAITPSHPALATIANLSESKIVPGASLNLERRSKAPLLRALRQTADGGFQITDESLVGKTEPAMWSATEESVTFSWLPLAGATGYRISKDGTLLTQTSATTFSDSAVKPGEIHNYLISSIFDDQQKSGGIWGFPVTIPSGSTVTLSSAIKAYKEQTALVTTLTTATVQYQTFISSATVSAPAVGCTYGSDFKFGGDNRTFFESGFPYRTKIQAQAGFTGAGTVTLQAATVGTTKVYNSAGTLVASATASASGLKATRLAASTGSVVDMRFSLAASNPFCPIGNSIQGAFTISVSKTGAWVISSGSHKQMPNHEIYIHSNVGGWVTAYIRSFADPICLINLACPTASITGSGSY